MATSSGNVGGGGYNKPVSTVIKRDISIKDNKSQANFCPCKNLPGKVTCGICNPKRK